MRDNGETPEEAQVRELRKVLTTVKNSFMLIESMVLLGAVLGVFYFPIVQEGRKQGLIVILYTAILTAIHATKSKLSKINRKLK